jgi:hypothetical protein
LVLQLGHQHASLAGSSASLQLQDSCCALLAGLSRAPATTAALAANAQLSGDMLRALHRVLHKPCCVQETDEAHVQCWMHAAVAACLPVLWQQASTTQQPQPQSQQQQQAGLLAAPERDQLLADIAVAAAGTFCNECSSTLSTTTRQLDAAAARLLAAALLPARHAYGSKQACVSRFMAAVVGSDCCHTLLHALAVAVDAHATQASNTRPLPGTVAAAAVDMPAQAGEAPPLVLVAEPQQVQPTWLILRMICTHCYHAAAAATPPVGSRATASDNDGSSSSSCHSRLWGAGGALTAGVQPLQVQRVVQAYSSHLTPAPFTSQQQRLLGSLHVLLCQAALPAHLQPQQQQRWLDAFEGGGASDDSSQQLLLAIGRLLDCMCVAEPGGGHAGAAGEDAMRKHLGWHLAAAAYVALAVALHVRGKAAPAAPAAAAAAAATAQAGQRPQAAAGACQPSHSLSACESTLALCGMQLAVAVLRLLLPVVVGLLQRMSVPACGVPAARDSSTHGAPSPTRQRSGAGKKQAAGLTVVLQEPWECCLAALQALAVLSQAVSASLPSLVSELAAAQQPGSAVAATATAGQHRQLPGFSAATCKAAAAGAAAALGPELRGLLAQLVTAATAATANSSGAARGAVVFASLPAALQDSLQQEVACWAAAALTSCYGQLGAPSWAGGVLAAAGEAAALANVQLLLGDRRLPVVGHAALLAAGSPVLRQQLASKGSGALSSDAGAAAGTSLKMSAALDGASVMLALGYVHTGAAQLPQSGCLSQLQLCGAALAALFAGPPPQQTQRADQQQRQADESQQQLLQQQAAAWLQLQALGLVAKGLQLPLLAALCRGSLPRPGQQLHALHPRLAQLLPQHLFLDASVGPAAASAVGAGADASAAAAALQGAQPQQQQGVEDDADSSEAAQQAVARHGSCSSYLAMLAAARETLPHLQQAQHTHAWRCAAVAAAAAAAATGSPSSDALLFANVLLAAPAAVDGERSVLALLSQRWAQQQQQQQGEGGQLQVLLLPEADVHVAAALLHYLYTGTLSVSLPASSMLLCPAQLAHTAPAPQLKVCGAGCSAGCHQARVLLRLWRCAELLLLPALQQVCLRHIWAAAAGCLGSGCCVTLLQDCWELGVPAAADGIAAALVARTAGVHRVGVVDRVGSCCVVQVPACCSHPPHGRARHTHAGKEQVAALPEWRALQPSMQDSLAKAWAERLAAQQQQDGESDAAAMDATTAAAAECGMSGLQLGASLDGAFVPSVGSGGGTALGRLQQQDAPWSVVLQQQLVDGLQQAAASLHRLLHRPVSGHGAHRHR